MSTVEIRAMTAAAEREEARLRYERLSDASMANGVERGREPAGDLRKLRAQRPEWWMSDAPFDRYLASLRSVAYPEEARAQTERDRYAAMLRDVDAFLGLDEGWEHGN